MGLFKPFNPGKWMAIAVEQALPVGNASFADHGDFSAAMLALQPWCVCSKLHTFAKAPSLRIKAPFCPLCSSFLITDIQEK